MKLAAPVLALLLQAASAAPAMAQQGCPNVCPDGMVWSQETAKCEPYKPLLV